MGGPQSPPSQHRKLMHAWRRRHIIVSRPEKYDCTVKVSLSKTLFYPGEVVDGFVTVKSTHSAAEGGVPIKSLRVRFTGKEHARIEGLAQSSCFIDQCVTIAGPTQTAVDNFNSNKDDGGIGEVRLSPAFRTAMESDQDLSTNPLLATETIITNTSTCPYETHPIPPLQAGEYTYPFRFLLPSSATQPPTETSNIIPSSCHVQRDENCSAEVVYQIKAVLEVKGDTNATNAAYFDVLTPVASDLLQRKEANSMDPLSISAGLKRSLWCFSLGVVMGTISVSKPIFIADSESVSIHIHLDCTKSKVAVEGCTVRLMQRVEILSSRDGQPVLEVIEKCVSKNKITNTIQACSFGAYDVSLALAPNFAPTATLFHTRWSYHVNVLLDGNTNEVIGDLPIVVAQATLDSTTGVPAPVLFSGSEHIKRLFTREKYDNGQSSGPRPSPQEFSYKPPSSSVVPLKPFATVGAGGGATKSAQQAEAEDLLFGDSTTATTAAASPQLYTGPTLGGAAGPSTFSTITAPPIVWAPLPKVQFPSMPGPTTVAFQIQPQAVPSDEDESSSESDDNE